MTAPIMMPVPPPFSLLGALFGDPEMARIFSEERTIEGWLEAEVALARAQASVGVLTHDEAEAIAHAATLEHVDRPQLWAHARNVGYPILPLIRQIGQHLLEGPRLRLHYGATTQDIMDTGLCLQLRDACERFETLLIQCGVALERLIVRHATTVIAARTHAQQAVPTTFGAKLAVTLSEITRQLERVRRTRFAIAQVSLHGAGGTSAALGIHARAIRLEMARRLDLTASDVPWHVSRDAIAEFGLLAASLASSMARFAREVVDLSRTEIGELREPDGHHRGASSTMPQKANPINSEAVIGMAASAAALSSAMYRAMEAGHERSAGEWQVEWFALPHLAALAAGALSNGLEVMEGLRVYPEVMRANLKADSGLVMSEAYMIRLAEQLGQAQAHDLVYAAVREVRTHDTTLLEALRPRVPDQVWRALEHGFPILPEAYTGEAQHVCRAAVSAWHDVQTAAPRITKETLDV